MSFDLTVLGSAGSHTGPGRACSSYLLRSPDTTLLVDCGNGSTANLQRHVGFTDLDAVLVTHKHVDHCSDLVGMYYALRFHADGPRQVDLYAAPGVVETLAGMLEVDTGGRFAMEEVFRCHAAAAGAHLELGSFAVDLAASIHPVPTVSVRIAQDGAVLVYSSDSAGGDDLRRVAQDADLFLCEATWQGRRDDHPPDIHLVATDAGRVATEAGVGTLLLTHVLGSLDPRVSLEQAGETYGGSLELAEDNRTIRIGAVGRVPVPPAGEGPAGGSPGRSGP